MEAVPRTRAGKLHRARKTPMTMMSEITRGEIPMETSFVGASAAPSQEPAVKPERIPSSCSLRERAVSEAAGAVSGAKADCIYLRAGLSMNETEKKQSAQQHRDGDPKMNIG